MLSGSGRTLLNLVDEISAGRLPAKILLVVGSRECVGLERARTLGLPSAVLRKSADESRELADMLRSSGIEWIVLAGYLRKLPILPEYRGRIVNIHPSLLPKFGGQGMYGDRVHEAVLKAGESESGCTVHLVDDEYDQGPVVLQRRCPVLPGDDVHTLAQRVFEQEKLAYPEALRGLLAGKAGAP
jgi:phosphoribosylglycinamide formyltransferase 1